MSLLQPDFSAFMCRCLAYTSRIMTSVTRCRSIRRDKFLTFPVDIRASQPQTLSTACIAHSSLAAGPSVRWCWHLVLCSSPWWSDGVCVCLAGAWSPRSGGLLAGVPLPAHLHRAGELTPMSPLFFHNLSSVLLILLSLIFIYLSICLPSASLCSLPLQ